VLLKLPYASRQLRPGGVISGPTQMALADTAAYALVLAHIGEVAMAVTTSLTIHFLRGCKPGDLLRRGRPCSSWAAASRRPMS
jgi:acyl-coenzyme A thioesterase PaaI-like protein